jgi:glycosyltransferase involved in cell wall biosynthesis
MNILIYYPYNLRSVEQLSVMELLLKKGHTVTLLTTCNKGPLHGIAADLGVITESVDTNSERGYAFYIKNLRKLRTAIKKYNIDVVFAHQQKPALIAGLLKRFVPFQLFYIRHNSDEDYLAFPYKAKWLNKIVNWLTTVKIAPSGIVQKFWIENEKVDAALIHRINYGYNFDQYEKPQLNAAEIIRKQFDAKLLIISIARLVPAKRHKEMFEIIKQMRTNGVDCKLICLGNGPIKAELTKLIGDMHLEPYIHLLGRKENIFDYISASDLFLHLSTSEASNSAVKEVGLCRKPVIVCKGVGDFQEYIIDRKNSFLVSKEDPVPDVCAILHDMATFSINKVEVGNQLYETVINVFNIDKVSTAYDDLLNSSR